MDNNSEPLKPFDVEITEGQQVTVQPILEFDFIGLGIDRDNQAWIVDWNGSRRLVLAELGTKYFASPDHLQNRIKEYELTLNDTRKALGLLELPNVESTKTKPSGHLTSKDARVRMYQI